MSHETGYDLYTPEVRKQVLDADQRETLDVVILAPECTPWSQRQNPNAEIPNQVKKLRGAKDAEREVLKFCSEISALADKCGKYYVLEQPKGSQMPKQLELSSMMKTALAAEVDMGDRAPLQRCKMPKVGS